MNKLIVPQNYSLHTHWLAIEGKVPNIPENEGEEVEEYNTEKTAENQVDITHQLSLEQQVYYNKVLEVLDTGVNLETILESLNTDSSLTRLIPYISRSMFAIILDSDELEILDRGIKILGSLSLNLNLNLEPYLHQIMPALLSGLMRSDLLEDGHCIFRKNTAGIIAKVCRRFNEYYEDLEARVLSLYVQVLENPDKPPASHYAAVQGVNAFGTLSIKNLLVPLLSNYVTKVLEPGLKTKDGHLWSLCKTAIIVMHT